MSHDDHDVPDDGALTLQALIARAEHHAHVIYEGARTPHRSCGVAIAETFGRNPQSYQSLRKGGITGCGECGAIKGGELVLGELLGDPDPAGAVTDALRQAAFRYRELWQRALNKQDADSIVCNHLTSPFPEFRSPERHAFCTGIATTVAGCVAQTLGEIDPESNSGWREAVVALQDWSDAEEGES